METRRMIITPAMAQSWLDEANICNRNINFSKVDAIARDISNNSFRLTHQGIAFADDGVLLDGQHRLLAIVKGGVPVEMLVSFGIERENAIYIDLGRPRSYSDTQRIAGRESVDKHSISGVKAAYVFGTGRGDSVPVTIREVSVLLGEFSEELEWLKGSGIWMCKSPGVFQSPIVAAVLCALKCRCGRTRLKQFCSVLGNKVTPDGEQDDAARLLFNWLIANRKNLGGSARQSKFLKCQAAIRHFLDERPIKTLVASREVIYPYRGTLAV